MAQVNWGRQDPHMGFQDQYDQGYATAQTAPRETPYGSEGYRQHPPVSSPRSSHSHLTAHPQPAGYSHYNEPPVMRSQYVHPAHGGAPAQPHVPPQSYAQPYGAAPYAAQPQSHPVWQQDHYDAAPMAAMDDGFDSATVGPAARARFGGVLNVTGAALSLALIVGLGVWGYKLAVRDVTGIPVVRALEGPMRVQPDNPGGLAAAHQGLAVNSVQAEGEASGPADRLVLAPAPEGLSEEDMITEATATVPAEMQTPEVTEAVRATPQQIPADPVAAAMALAEQLAAGAAPLSGEAVNEQVVATVVDSVADEAALQAAAAQEAIAEAGDVDVIAASVPGVRLSPRPAARPDDMETLVAATATTNSELAITAVTDVSADTIPAGTRLVQLGAFDSADVAKAEWEKLSVRFEDYLSGKSRVIQQATSGGKTFYRLRAMGFEDLADARRFCAVLMASKAACIPVVTR